MDLSNLTSAQLPANDTLSTEATVQVLAEEESTGIPVSRIILGLVLYSIAFVTIFGNLLVILAVAREKKLQTVFNIFIVNLAFTDVNVGIVMGFFATFNVLQEWPFGEGMCAFWIFLDFGMTFASIFTLLAISIDRYWSVHWGNHYRIHNTKKKAVVITIAIWTTMVVLWGPPFIIDRVNNSTPDECFYDPAKNKIFVMIVAIVGYHGSTVVMLFCYIKVFLFVHQRSKTGPLRSRPVGTQSGTSNAKKTATTTEPVSASDTTKVRNSPEGRENRTFENDNGTVEARPPPSVTFAKGTGPSVTGDESSVSERPSMATRKVGPQPSRQADSGGSEDQKSSTLKREQKVFLTLSYIMVGYLICWMPFHISFDIMAYDITLVPSKFYDVTYWLAYCNSAMNPFLYNFSSPEFHRAFKRMFCRG